jgi:Ni,Fe-hydrogenase III small subunit
VVAMSSVSSTLCQEIEIQHVRQALPEWNAEENQIPCLEHAVHLSVVLVMDHVTKRTIAESSMAIWEYNPSLKEKNVAGGRPDVLSVLHTVNVKVRASLTYSSYDAYSVSTI